MPNDIVITPGSKLITFQDGSNTQQRLMLTGSNLTYTGTLKAASFTGSLSGSVKNISGTTNYVPKFTSTSNLGNSVIYDNSGNIGIGTTSPAYKLEVVASSTSDGFRILGSGISQFVLTGDGVMYWGSGANYGYLTWDTNVAIVGGLSSKSLAFQTNATEKARIDTNGNVGIGTSSPAAKLEVSSGEVRISSAAAYITHLNYLNAGSNYITTANDGATIFRGSSNNVTVMTVLGGGNVGIGTSSPIAKLHITGSATVPAALFMGNIGVGTTSLIYPVSNRALIEMYGPSDAICALRNSNGNSYIQKYSTDFYLVNNDTGFISIQTNLSERVRIKSDGNVGIGTTSPECILDVVGATGKTYSSTNAGTLVLRDTANATTNVGGAILFKGYKTSNSAVAHFVAIDGVKENSTAGDESGTFRIHTANSSGTFSEKLRVTSGGNVGIGTTSPATKLDLKGNLFVANAANGNNTIAFGNIGTLGPLNGAPNNLTGSAFLVVSSSTASGAPSHMKFYTTSGGTCSERLRIAADGNVGIGTTGPAAKLNVYTGTVISDLFALTVEDNTSYIRYIPSIGGGSYNAASVAGGSALITTLGREFWIGQHDGAAIRFASDETLYIYNGSGNINLTSTTGGNIGIGTTSPTIAGGGLQIYGAGQKAIRISGNSSNSYSVEMGSDTTKMSYIQTIGSADRGLNFYTGNASTIVMTLTGSSVGIGTTSPSAKLHIVQSNSGGVAAIKLSEDESTIQGPVTNTQIRMGNNLVLNASNIMTMGTNGTEKMRVASDGNVGIGTSSPSTLLQVVGTGAGSVGTINIKGVNAHLGLMNASGTFKGWYGYYNSVNHGSDNDLNIKTGYGGTSNIRFSADAETTAAMLYIKSDGNIGIGTTSPKNKLHVAGLMTLDSTIIYSKVNTVTTNNPIRITIPFTKAGAGADFIVKVKAIAMADNASGVNYLDYVGYSGYTYNFNTNLTTVEKVGNVVVNSYVSASSATAGNLYIELNGDDGYLQDSNWTIQTDVFGNSRYSTFDSGSITTFATSISEDSLQTSFNKVFGGNVGIGTSSPDIFARNYGKVLGISGSSAGIEINSNTGQSPYFDMGVSGTRIGSILASSTTFEVGTIGANPLHLYTNNSYKLSIISNGNVGIGTTSPAYPLEVNGSLYATRVSGSNMFTTNGKGRFFGTASYALASAGGGGSGTVSGTTNYVAKFTSTTAVGNSIIFETGSKIGIGTTNPSSKLEVSGSLTDYATFNRRTGNYTMSLSDASKLIEMNVATANTVNVPTNAQVAFKVGTKVDIVQYGAGQTTITGSSGGGVQLRTANNWYKINARYGVASLVKVGTNEWYMFGNLSA
jgi:hypothetical protein